jgi:hypothetical protein
MAPEHTRIDNKKSTLIVFLVAEVRTNPSELELSPTSAVNRARFFVSIRQ